MTKNYDCAPRNHAIVQNKEKAVMAAQRPVRSKWQKFIMTAQLREYLERWQTNFSCAVERSSQNTWNYCCSRISKYVQLTTWRFEQFFNASSWVKQVSWGSTWTTKDYCCATARILGMTQSHHLFSSTLTLPSVHTRRSLKNCYTIISVHMHDCSQYWFWSYFVRASTRNVGRYHFWSAQTQKPAIPILLGNFLQTFFVCTDFNLKWG